VPGAKRPRLKVQIPSEHEEDGGSGTAEESPQQTGDADAPQRSSDVSHGSGVLLPPPSPSASAVLSAGAQGPPNPFARPLPPNSTLPQNSQAYNSNSSMETPISALPSRFVADGGLLPSPSQFYPEWNFGRSATDGNMLPSPLNFQTPVVTTGPSFPKDEESDKKRKSPETEGPEGVAAKRIKA
jgi:transcription factor RLM1